MSERDEIVKLVDERLQSFLTERSHAVSPLGPDVATFDTFAREFLSGGKRFRALCAIHGFRVGSCELNSAIIDVAAGLEVFHAAALVHDDIMDSSDTRRGRPSAHRAFETTHENEGWAGDRASFGVNAALLFGDLLLGYSDELICRGIDMLEASHRRGAREEFDRMRREVTLGQYLDIVEERAWPQVNPTLAFERSLRVVTYKSAKYSIEAPLAIGALIGGATTDDVDTLRAFGLPLGIAFQLRDDILGVFGDPSITGKPAGDDIREGKRTALIALAMESMSMSEQQTLNDILGDRSLPDSTIEDVRLALISTGALDRVETMISEQLSLAVDVIDGSGFSANVRDDLLLLADGVTRRVS